MSGVRMTGAEYKAFMAKVSPRKKEKDEKEPKESKYKNRKVEIYGITFDSAKEARRYQRLRTLEQAGVISSLRTQVPFVLLPKQVRGDGTKEREVIYWADFAYMQDGKEVVEDCKSKVTVGLATYVLKRKLLLHVHGITLLETV
jgi:hypothetical protein